MTETVMLDSSGKMYFPQKMREKMKTIQFVPLMMPDGEIILKPVYPPMSAEEKLETIKKMGLWKTKKSIRGMREGIYEDAGKRFGR